MTWRVILGPRAVKDLSVIREPDHSRIAARLLDLTLDPRPYGAVKLKESSYHRIRVGDWRVLYEIHDAERVVVAARVLRRSERTYRGLEG